MSVEKFTNVMRGQANMAGSNIGYTDVGTITAYDPTNRLVYVEISPATDDEQALRTGWIPLTTPWGGDGWGMFAAPATGVACLVHYQSGSRQAGFASLISFGGSTRPVSVDSGEFWLVHQSGSVLKFTNDGNVEISAHVNLTLSAVTEIDINAPTVNITASTECNISSPIIKAGEGPFQPLLKADSTPTTNLQGS